MRHLTFRAAAFLALAVCGGAAAADCYDVFGCTTAIAFASAI